MNPSSSRTPLESLLRNGLFILCVVGGISALGASIVPMRRLPAPTRPPAPAEQRSVREAVAQFDETLAAGWKSEGMMPSGLAPSGQVARRISLALTGSVPSLEEVRRFQSRWEAADELVAERTRGSSDAGKSSASDRAALFARLAAEPDEHRDVTLAWVSELVDRPTDRRFGDYWAERIVRSMVGTHQDPFILYRRRRFVFWLSDQLRANRPYDEVVRDMIAGTGVWTDKPGVNFITSTIKSNQGNNQPDPEELGAATARAFLGVRMDCAQCHDHPFVKSWKQSTFREFAAFYGQARNSLAGIQDDVALVWKPTDDGKPGAPVEPQVPFLTELLPPRRKPDGKGAPRPAATTEEELEPLSADEEASPEADPDEPPMMTMKGGVFARRKAVAGGEKPSRQRLAEWLTHPDNPYFAQATANRVWALMWGRALAEPLDDFVTAGNVPPLLVALGDDFRKHRYDLRRLIRIVAALRAYRGDSAADFEVEPAHEAAWAVFPMTRLRPEQVVGGVLQGSSLSTIDAQSHILTQLLRVGEQEQFIERYGDAAADEMKEQGGTIPQRLLMMNGDMVDKRIGDNPFSSSVEIAALAKDDAQAVDAAYWTILTRAPTSEERSYFTAALHGLKGDARRERLADLFWSLVNSTEFSWNH